MKTSDLQELKPVYVYKADYYTDDELSLIDLAMVLTRRKTMIAIIFIALIALGVALALFTPRTYTYSATIEIGSQFISGSSKPFESPYALAAKLQYSYILQVLIEHKQSSPNDKNRYQIKASVPEGSNIILLETKGTEDQGNTLIGLLQSVNQLAIRDHNRIYTSVKSDLEARLIQTTNTLKSLENESTNKTTIATNQNIIESLKSQLANLHNTREVLPPIRSIDPTGGSRKIIVVISAFAGIFLGIFVAFFSEFLSKIKQKINEKSNK